ncbi:cytochrome P450 [Aspergillus stella-maris]|uniref:cytochrome P450 n=1 Tax=Aspergillus stella-maris TaxID=1810926 RepID=UPI003CCDB76F
MSSTSDLPQYPFARPEKSYDPPAELKRLRDKGPVHRIQLFDGTPAWIVTRHNEVCELLSKDKLSNARYNFDGYPEIHPGTKKEGVTPTFVHMDDPEHAKQRAMVESLFTKSTTEKLRPQVQSIVDSLLSNIKKKGCKEGPVDLVSMLATPLNPKVLLQTIFAVSELETEKLLNSSTELGGTSGTATESDHTDLHDFMSRLVEERTKSPKHPDEDIVSKLVTEQLKPGNITRDQLITSIYMIFVAGNSAIMSSVALGILSLLLHPDQLEEVKRDPGLAGNVVEETLRFHTPSALNSRRVATADVELGGKEIKKGTGLIGSVRSANRDERVYTSPDTFNIHRNIDKNKNLAFGYGPHNCQGQWLSRLELEAVFGSILQKLPNLRLAVKPEKLEYTPGTQNVGVAKLPVYFD